MQSISLGNLKIEAHHDKITNEIANQTKLMFLSREMQKLREIMEMAQNLQNQARPQGNGKKNMEKLEQRMRMFKELLLEQVIKTRRLSALVQAQSANLFEGKVQEYYKLEVERLSDRTELMQQRVQKLQDSARLSNYLILPKVLSYRNRQRKQLFQKLIQKRKEVKSLIKRKLLLSQHVKKMNEVCQQSKTMVALRQGLSRREYHFQIKEEKYYLSKSVDRIEFKREIEPLFSLQLEELKRRKKPLSPQRTKELLDEEQINHGLMSCLQAEIIQESFEQIKEKNSQLQSQINSIKNALELREAKQTLKTLHSREDLQVEQSKAREMLSYLTLQRQFSNKLESLSYQWVSKPISSQKCKGKYKQWIEQPEQSPQICFKRQRGCSADHKKETTAISWPIRLKLDAFKSNERTNTSLERI